MGIRFSSVGQRAIWLASAVREWPPRPRRVLALRQYRAGTGRRWCRAVMVGLLLVVAGGCERARATNGLESKSAEQVQQDAAAALTAAGGVHVTGTVPSQGAPLRVDLRVKGTASSGTVVANGIQFDFTVVGDEFYLKGDQAAWNEVRAPPAVDGFAGVWVKLRPAQVKLALVSVDALVA